MPPSYITDHSQSSPLVIHQPRKGYRYSLDPFLLARFVTLKKGERVIDLGAGVGIIGLLLATRYPDCEVLGIEIQERLLAFGKKNAEENHLNGRVTNVLGDYRKITDYCDRSSFTALVSNPPYRPLGTGRKNQNEESAAARHELVGGLAHVAAAAEAVLRSTGRVFLIYDAERIADLFIVLRSSGFEPKRVRFVHAREGSPARLVMVEGRRNSGVQVTVMPPLFVWGEAGVYTEEAREMFEGLRANSY